MNFMLCALNYFNYIYHREQQQNRSLDIITGFQVLDGTQHIFVLEGLIYGAVNYLWTTIATDRDNGKLPPSQFESDINC